MFNTPHLNPLEWLAAVVLIVGGLNWGLVGLFEYDLVAQIFGEEFGTTNWASRAVYIIVGASAIYTLLGLLRMEAMTTKEQREREVEGPAGRRRAA
ncbi:MAG: DUF378 domain-containing protein [Dehalococcoidia bacterium]